MYVSRRAKTENGSSGSITRAWKISSLKTAVYTDFKFPAIANRAKNGQAHDRQLAILGTGEGDID